MAFENRLKQCRLAKNVTQEQAAKDLDIPKNTYCNYERDEREPSAMTALKLASYYEVSLDYLYGNTNEVKKNPPPSTEDSGRQRIVDMLSSLKDNELDELEKFVDFIIWKRGL